MEVAGIHTGVRTLVDDRNLAERRLAAIVRAIRDHEASQWRKPYPRREDDLSLYRRVEEVLADPD